MSTDDVSDVFRNARVDTDKAHNFCNTVGELVVTDCSLSFGWSGSPGFWSVMSATGAHAQCNTTIHSAQLLDKFKRNAGSREGGRKLGRRETDTNTAGRKVRTHSGGGEFDPFFTAVYVDDNLQVRVQHSDDDTTRQPL